jgi:hypothetical protein
MKALSSAKTAFRKQKNGQLILEIQHDTIRHVTPRMLKWWFEHLSDPMSYEGKSYSRYLLWHPRDHILWQLVRKSASGGSGQGAYFRIVEAFAANPAYYIDSVEYVEKLDEEGLSLVRRLVGMEIFRLEHRFGTLPEGSSYQSRMIVGVNAGLPGRLFNDYIRPVFLSNAAAQAWLTHNIEEVSMFEHILPFLYREFIQDDGA